MKKMNLLFAISLVLMGLISSLLIVSCTDEPVNIEEESLSEFERQLVLPKGLDLDGEELTSYLDNADEDLLNKLEANAKLAHYLIQNDLFIKVYKEMNVGQHFSDFNIAEKLSQEQLIELEHFSFSNHLKGSLYSCMYAFYHRRCIYYRCCYFEFPVCWIVKQC